MPSRNNIASNFRKLVQKTINKKGKTFYFILKDILRKFAEKTCRENDTRR